ncbi:putative Zn(II)2Cys6 transcription factor [Aspergillus mulundensis]|uniref:Putative Zn(II)2Cys6 transcription factor n=1 Tax=Aspergillus mulundensis TaxID=1810919 RepID=A0A3D8T6N9_9EURO|nr:putative Zn(II)2Cys6 transcription factor [Aspergillus mulundensis]RDW94227.1 putative Zn(II)2Cys6 transcription factor [Aspergillus mulundensis]
MEERIRKRIPKSCRRCHRRKQRCVGAPVCANCELAGQPCLRSDSVPSWHHGMSKGALAQRIETLEAQLAALTESRSEGGSHSESRNAHQFGISSETTSPGTGPSPGSVSGIGSNASTNSPENHGAVMHFLIQGPGGYEDKVEGNYLGPSSGLTIAENISRIVQDAVWKSIPVNETHEFMAPCENDATGPADAPDDAIGARILEAYFKSMQMRLPFLCRAEIYGLHARRHEPVGPSTVEQFARFKIFMVYAIGAAILRMTEMYDSTPPRNYFVTAMQYQPAIQGSLSISSIEALMLLAMYNLQSSASSSVWYMMGLATRICVDFGLHREAQYRRLRPYEAQRRRRLFWSVYLNERSVAWSLGRPFSIGDEEIDAEPPADIDDSLPETADKELFQTPKNPSEQWDGPNIRCFIACIKLSRISSRTRASVYRLDRDTQSLLHQVHPLLEMLDEYQRTLPCLSDYENDFIQMHWNSATRTLLHPFLNILPPDDDLARRCLYSSGQMCQYFKRLRQRDSTWYSFLLINTLFMAGLTICLCLFRSPRLWTISVSNDLRACSSALFVMAERHPSVRKYRDALETAINRVMDYVNDAQMHSQHQGHTSGGMAYSLDRALTDPPTPGFYIPSPQASRAGAGPGLGGETPEIISLFDGRAAAFSNLFTEDFWAGDAFGLHMGESFGLRT